MAKPTQLDARVTDASKDGDKTVVKTDKGELEIVGSDATITSGSKIKLELGSTEDQQRLAEGARVTAKLVEVVEAASEEVEVRNKEG